jgi:signal-transduction protein with cAMP-binding, CBS, and nucleotidyltransferase domain
VPAELQPADTVSAITDPVVAEVRPSATVREVAEELVDDEVGAVLVRGHRPVTDVLGVVSERDVAAVVARGEDPRTVTAADVMSTDLVAVTAGASLRRAAEVMLEAGVRHVVVRDGDGAAGVVSMRAVLAALLAHGGELR